MEQLPEPLVWQDKRLSHPGKPGRGSNGLIIMIPVAVMHAYALDEAEKLKQRISSEFNCAELWLTEFSPLMGYACGTGTLGLAFYKEN